MTQRPDISKAGMKDLNKHAVEAGLEAFKVGTRLDDARDTIRAKWAELDGAQPQVFDLEEPGLTIEEELMSAALSLTSLDLVTQECDRRAALIPDTSNIFAQRYRGLGEAAKALADLIEERGTDGLPKEDN
jgi:hypothetical protein